MTTGDTNPDNPVHNYPADVFPIGAALTIAYGSNERPFTTLGNLYRILGFLTGGIPGPYDINAAIDKCRAHVVSQLPDALRAIDVPPPDHAGEAADVAWVTSIIATYGPTITLTPMPPANGARAVAAPNLEGYTAHEGSGWDGE
jgi:hypothetical protein